MMDPKTQCSAEVLRRVSDNAIKLSDECDHLREINAELSEQLNQATEWYRAEHAAAINKAKRTKDARREAGHRERAAYWWKRYEDARAAIAKAEAQ